MKSTKKNMKEEFLSNNPKTYGIVYKGSVEVINWKGAEMYFRSKDIAERFKQKAEPVFCDVELEVIQFNPTAEEMRNKEVLKDLAHDLSIRKKSVPRMAKKRYKKHSTWLSRLEKDREEWIAMQKYKKKRKTKELEDEDDYF